MADRILVNVPEITEAKNQYASAKQDELNAITAIDSAIKALGDFWKGDAANAYRSVYDQLKANLDSSQAAMADAISDLEKAIAQMENASGETSSNATGLDVGEAFPIQS